MESRKGVTGEHGKTLDIVLSRKGDNYVDSLKSDAIDLVVIPYSEAIKNDGVQTSIPIDSSSLWLVPTKEILDIRILNKWIYKYHHTAEIQSSGLANCRRLAPVRIMPKQRVDWYNTFRWCT